MSDRLTICGELACPCSQRSWICHSGVRLGPMGPVLVDRIDSVSAEFVLLSPDSVRCKACKEVSCA